MPDKTEDTIVLLSRLMFPYKSVFILGVRDETAGVATQGLWVQILCL